jgi:hypothetical protein
MAASRSASAVGSQRPTAHERARLDSEGFVLLPGVLDGCDFAPVRRVIAAANRAQRHLPAWARQDLGDRTVQLPQINSLTRLYPHLRRTEVVRRLHQLADHHFGEPTALRFDFSITKPPGSTAEVPWHQDRAYHPDDDAAERLHVWIPMQDTNATMGCMEYLPGSHLLGPVLHSRASEGHSYALAIEAEVAAEPVRCETPRGAVVLHRSLTWHRTGPNTSGSDRAMWALEFEPISAGRGPRISVERGRRVLDVARYRWHARG